MFLLEAVAPPCDICFQQDPNQKAELMATTASLVTTRDTANAKRRAGTRIRESRLKVTSVLGAVAVCFALAACSGADKADVTPDSTEKTKEVTAQEKIAREALIRADLKSLSDHKADSGKPIYAESDRAPFRECAVADSAVKAMVGHVSQEFDGDPKLTTLGFAVAGDGTEVFHKLRKTWIAKECENHEAKGSAGKVTYVETHEIQPPDGLDTESWFGACYSGFRAEAGESGRCIVIYRVGDNGIAEIRSIQDSKANRNVAAFLRKLAAEALAG